MGIFDRVKSLLPQKQLNSSLFQFFAPSAMPKLAEKDYLKAYQGWVFAAVNAIAERFADTELSLEERTKDGWKQIPEHEALKVLHKANNFMSYYDLAYSVAGYQELTGNAFWYVVRNGAEKVAELWPLDPTRVSIVKDKEKFIAGYVYRNEMGKDVPLKVDEVIPFKRFNPKDMRRGMGTVEAAALAIDIDTYASEWQRNFFGNSAMPAGVLSTENTLTQEQYERIKLSWDQAHRGVANAHKMAVLEGGLTWTSISPTSKDMQFLDGRKNTRDEILAYFRVPKAVLGMAEDFNRANIEGVEYIFAKYVIRPKIKAFVNTLNEYYLPKFKLDPARYRFNFTDPVPENIEEKLRMNEVGMQNGYMTINEARAAVNLPAIDGGDELSKIQTSADPGQGGNNSMGTPQKTVQKATKLTRTNEQQAKVEGYLTEQETLMKEKYLNLNDALKSNIIERLGKYKTHKPKNLMQKLMHEIKAEDDIARFLFENYNDWVGLVFDATKEGLTRIYGQSGKDALTTLGMGISFDLLNPRAVEWIASRALSSSTSYTDNIKEGITAVLKAGVEQGLGAREIGDKIAQDFFQAESDYRAERIARTETITAYGEGSLEGYRQSGVVKGKYWIVGTLEVCPICLDNQAAGVIGLNDLFPSGHDGPSAHPNCRCTVAPAL